MCVCICMRASERASEQFALSLSLSRIGFLHDESKVYLKTKASRKLAKRNGGDQNTRQPFCFVAFDCRLCVARVRLNSRVYVCVCLCSTINVMGVSKHSFKYTFICF